MDGVADGEDMKVLVYTDRARSHHGAEKGDFALDALEELIWCLVVHCDQRLESNIWCLFGSHNAARMINILVVLHAWLDNSGSGPLKGGRV